MTNDRDHQTMTSDIDLAAFAANPNLDLDTIRRVKELCARYGAEKVKEMVTEVSKAA